MNVRFFDAFVDRGFWVSFSSFIHSLIQLFAAFYVAYLNRYSRDLEYEMGSDDESNVSQLLEHIRTLSLDDVELLLADSIHLTFVFSVLLLRSQRELRAGGAGGAAAHGDHAAAHRRGREHHEHLQISHLLRHRTLATPHRSALQATHAASAGPRAVAGPAAALHVSHPRISRDALAGVGIPAGIDGRKATYHKPTLLLMQIEHNGNYIGLYREDRWSRRRDAHGVPETLLFSIVFYTKKGETYPVIEKWSGRGCGEGE